MFLSRAPSPLITTRVSVSVLPLKNPFGPIFSSFRRRDFVVRAESSPEGEVEAVETNGEGAEKVEVG
ncbi:hypothetical protein SLEP1_g8962 [Rubroshorea leprosula]|uniref:Uncharacterized protein n=1 Tax=Rubroshorea leprosula TaxID=152421 RepID=A0AAV5I3I6_9ROSI|nr:hypothetical protein SLEP1_g8962 [Rubroshorea leprosula]